VKRHEQDKPTVLLAAAAALVACGGGSGMSGTTPWQARRFMATGTIPGFGASTSMVFTSDDERTIR